MRKIVGTIVTLLTLMTLAACNRAATPQRTQPQASPSPKAEDFSKLQFSGTSAPPELGEYSRQDEDSGAKTISDRPTDQIAGLKIFSVAAYGEPDPETDVPPIYALQATFESSDDAAKQESLNGLVRVFGVKSFNEVEDVVGKQGVGYQCGQFSNGQNSPSCSYVLGNLLVIVAGQPGFDEDELFQLAEELAADHLDAGAEE
jgi:hypothetical protein